VVSTGKDIPAFPLRFLGLTRKGLLAFRYPWAQWKERVMRRDQLARGGCDSLCASHTSIFSTYHNLEEKYLKSPQF